MDTSDDVPISRTCGHAHLGGHTPDESASQGSPWTRALEREGSLDSEETMWLKIREDDGTEAPSEAPTPAPAEIPGTPRPGSDGSGTPVTKTTHIDAEDEDVKIAIMALGAMRHFDGRPKTNAEGGNAHRISNEDPVEKQSQQPLQTLLPETAATRERYSSYTSMAGTLSIVSTSPVASTTVSSLSSTSATEWTASSASTTPSCSITFSAQHAEGASSSRSSSSRSSGTSGGGSAAQTSGQAATLADLPSEFEFAAIVRDENGNEVEVDREMMRDADFLARVSHMPIVRGTLKAYELGKQKSKLVRYGGYLVESSVKAISRPVVGRLGASLGDKGKEQLDDFACRQLDRIYPGSAGTLTKEERLRIVNELDERKRIEWAHMDAEECTKRRRAYWALLVEEKEREMIVSEPLQHKGKERSPHVSPSRDVTQQTATATTQEGELTGGEARAKAVTAGPHSGRALVEEVTKSGSCSLWSSMLIEAGATAGGLSAAMSEESIKSLKYCLQWLQYATAHIEHQITVLRDLIVKLNHGELELTSPAAQNLTQIKGDVVNTIRSVVDVVGKYAGGALPEPARVSVKAFILSLPARWATVNRAPARTNGSCFGGSLASPSFSAEHMGGSPSASSSGDASGIMSAAATAQAANRVLTLAVESLDILRSVTVVVGESLDRADLWVERLRMLGIQRKRQYEQEAVSGPSDPNAGRLEASPHWESARGLASHRRESIGAGSDVSVGTSASTKRRRMRNEGGHQDGFGLDDDYRPHHHSSLIGSPVNISGNGSTMSNSVSYGRLNNNGVHFANGGGSAASAGATAGASRRRRCAAMASRGSGGI